MRLLLISNSGEPFYEWCKSEIVNFAKREEILFISAADMKNSVGYFEKVKGTLEPAGLKITHLLLNGSPREQIVKAKIFLVGGGNTYYLLKELGNRNLLKLIRDRVFSGAGYIGISAGANIAGPNILTTNDWNVIGYTSFEGLNLVPFNINPHYIPPHDKKIFSGESRDDRIREYHLFSKNPVAALEEKTLIRIERKEIKIKGKGRIYLFKKDSTPQIFAANSAIGLEEFCL